MLQRIRKLKEKKGFTLVELIVVLVILAILAALLIPALTGYIDKANKEKVTAEARMVVMAIQTESSSAYGHLVNATLKSSDVTVDNVNKLAELSKLAGTDTSKKTACYYVANIVATTGKVESVEYHDGSGWTCNYTPDKGFVVSDTKDSAAANNSSITVK